jgi:hypothetical protein
MMIVSSPKAGEQNSNGRMSMSCLMITLKGFLYAVDLYRARRTRINV